MNKTILNSTLLEIIKPIVEVLVKEHLATNQIRDAPKQVVQDPKFLTIKQASEFLGLAKPTIYGLVSKRKLPHFKRGMHLFFDIDALINWVKEGKRKTKEEHINTITNLKQKKRNDIFFNR